MTSSAALRMKLWLGKHGLTNYVSGCDYFFTFIKLYKLLLLKFRNIFAFRPDVE